MTPRQSAIEALSGRRPQDLVPHFELEFQLCEEHFGKTPLRAEHLQDVTGTRRRDMLKRNAELWVDVATKLKWNIITGLHWLPVDDQCESFEYVREIAGDTFMLSAFVDGTYAIPDGTHMMDFAMRLADQPDKMLEEAQQMAEGACKLAQQLIGAGAEVIFMCADYCFNDGPFLSPRMFSRFVTPFLAQIVTAIKKAGAFAVKHTDGDIMPILDQLVSTGIDALHSLDPMAGVDIAQVRQIVGPNFCLIGNVNCAWVQAGTHDQIRESALYCLRYGGVDSGAYIYSTSNCIFKGGPLENYLFMLRLRDEYGHPGTFATDTEM
ncbi:MAG: uroporphyrinogen decarboxylase family protein [Armatimonadetes bacterium]|nr:uroporphyrinogen decarboxylase family protein [Armatimonadota bacterium]